MGKNWKIRESWRWTFDRELWQIVGRRVKQVEDWASQNSTEEEEEQERRWIESERKGRVEKQGREVRMWKGFEGVIRGKHYYERVSERLERKKHWLLFAWTYTMNLLYFRRYVLNIRES